MTEWYSHPDARQLDAIIETQTVIAGIDQSNETNYITKLPRPGEKVIIRIRVDGSLAIIRDVA